MSLTETKLIDQITVTETGHILVREVNRILKDGQQIAETFHRWSFEPNSDVSEMPDKVQKLCKYVWENL